MWQKLILFLLLGSSVSAQSFFYSYVDPCQKSTVQSTIVLNNGVEGFQVTYYNRSKFFTLDEALKIVRYDPVTGEPIYAISDWTEQVYQDFQAFPPLAQFAPPARSLAPTATIARIAQRAASATSRAPAPANARGPAPRASTPSPDSPSASTAPRAGSP